MKLSNEILTTAFHTTGMQAIDQADKIGDLVRINGSKTFIDRSTVASSLALESLLLGYDPRSVAQTVFKNCQEISLDAFCAENDYSNNAKLLSGMSAEIAVHGLLWWGIRNNPQFGRYARISATREDASGEFGQRNGYDIVFRTDRRRHRIQVKTDPKDAEYTERYVKDIIVTSPAHLLGDLNAYTNDLHEAIVAEDTDVLRSAINRFTQILHTQKATNGRRKVI